MPKYVKLLPLLIALALLAGMPAGVSGQVETTVSFSATSYSVDEGDGTVTVTIEISDEVTFAASVELSTSNGTAIAGRDYTAVTETVTFPANSTTSQTVDITVNDDAFVEYVETFTVSLESDDERVAVGNPATVAIESEDTLELAFESETYTVQETSGSFRVTIRVVSPTVACPFDGSFSVRVSTVDGTATSPRDYSAVSTIVVFRPCIVRVAPPRITLINDLTVEATENFTLRMERTQSTPDFVTFSQAEATVEILDNADRATVRIERQSYTVDESASTVEIRMRLYNPDRSTACVSAVPISLGLSTPGGTAEPSLDYEPVDTTVTFEPCDRVRAIGIPIIDDGTVENTETFRVRLVRTESTDRRIGVDSSTSRVEIRDNDTVSLGFESAEYPVNEGDSIPLRVNLSGDPTCPVAFGFDVLLGSAIPRGARSTIAKPTSRLAFKPCDLGSDITIDTGDIEATAELRFALERSSSIDSRFLLGQSTATAYVIDVGGTTAAFDTLGSAGNNNPEGIWSNGTTMWVADLVDNKIYAYDMNTKQRVEDLDFDTLNGAGNDDPAGLWSDNETMWVAEYGFGHPGKIYAYNIETKANDTLKEFDTLDPENDDPEGIWSNGTTMWVSDPVDDKIYAYNINDKSRDDNKDFNTLDQENDDQQAIWSDGNTMWVADSVQDKIFAYNMSTKAWDPDKDFNGLTAAGNTSPRGLWSDGTIMWVSDEEDDKIYAYYFPQEPSLPTVRRPSTGQPTQVTFEDSDPARPSTVPANCISEVVDEDGGEIELGDIITDRWVSGCPSITRGGRLAKYYTFNLPITTAVEIALDSHLDDYLVLRRGGLSGNIVEQDDDDGPGNNSLIDKFLTAGKYTIEATTFYADGVGADFTMSVRAVPRILYDGPVANVAHADYAPDGPTMTVKLLPTLPIGTLEITVEDPDGFGEGAGPLGGAQTDGGSAGAVLLALPRSAWVQYDKIAVETRESGAWSPHTQADEQAMLTRHSPGPDLSPALLGLVRLIGKTEGALQLLQSLAGLTSSAFTTGAANPDESVLDAIFRKSHANCVAQVTVPWLVEASDTTGVRILVPVMLDDDDYLSLAASFVASEDQPALAQLHDLLATGDDAPACQAPDAEAE